MTWRLMNKPVTSKVTKALAAKFVDMEASPNDRVLSERRLMVYERLFREGSFRPVTWASAYCEETGATYRVNGKHTSHMLYDMEELPEFFVTVEEYICPTLEDVAHLYATFDSKMISRTSNDIYLSFAGTVKELTDVPKSQLILAIQGIAYHLMGGAGGGDRYGKSQPAERAELILDHADFVLWLVKLLNGGNEIADRTRCRRHYHLQRMPVVAAMLASWLKAKGPATEFWEAVRDGSGATPEMPDRKLEKWLLTSVTSTKGHSTGKTVVSTREVHVRCLHSWNAWRRHEPTDLRYYPAKPVPAIV